MEMRKIVIEGKQDVIDEQEAEERTRVYLAEKVETGQANEKGQPPHGFDRIARMFGDDDAAMYWLTAPNDALDGAEPLELLHKGEAARVEAAATGYLQGDFG